jgi:SpoVK/Ycf46/Vps4 family AAA+-type ATPase
LSALNSEVSEYVMEVEDSFGMDNIVCPEPVKNKLNRIIREYVQRDMLFKNNLTNRSKILLTGPSGTGKTMTASILANELHLPLYVVRMERIIIKYLGESSLKLAKVFDLISNVRGVYLFDEFDAIGMQRGQENEVGEMRRILNTFLQMMERTESDSLIVAATNCGNQLDKALFRRFDDVIEYSLPNEEEIETLLSHCLYGFDASRVNFATLLPLLKGMSHAEITAVCMDAVKESLLEEMPIDNMVMEVAISQKNSTAKMIG